MAKSLFEQLGGTYHEENEYFILYLRLPAEEELPIGCSSSAGKAIHGIK
ncbi:MAG: hypothetical protein HFJ10_07045 [Lachnospiraceae bacterium]|nr:hypothetical protein [Lachnospiraceae bacterium]